VKASFRGRYSLAELRQGLTEALDQMERYGIEELTAVHLYFTPWKGREKFEMLTEQGEPAGAWEYKIMGPRN
jgi:hypothetical protein